MRNKSISLIFISLTLWATVTYILIFHQPPDEKKEHRFVTHINSLERELNQLLMSNEKLLDEFNIKYIYKDKKMGNSSMRYNLFQKYKYLNEWRDLPAIAEHNENSSPTSLLLRSHYLRKWMRNYSREEEVIARSPQFNLNSKSPVIAVLVISCNRITVRRCIDQLITFRPSTEKFPIIVSQDCIHKQTSEVIKSYGDAIIHIQQPDQSEIDVPLREKKFKGYFKIARHYGWALNEIFFKFNFETAIVVEDDLDISPDFYEYFLGTHSILVKDSSLWCVSAWNDNGKAGLVDLNSPHLLYRTDFFPGLGWMLTKKLWQELSPKWPKSYWDDWIRQPEQRKNRACIRPELSRTRTFGKIGVSNGLFYEKHLQFIKLNEELVPFTTMNLSYLLKENYDVSFINDVYKSQVITYSDLKNKKDSFPGSIRIPYDSHQSYKSAAKMLGLMDDFKSGIPRTGYRGIVTFFYKGWRVYLAPSTSWSGYDVSWS